MTSGRDALKVMRSQPRHRADFERGATEVPESSRGFLVSYESHKSMLIPAVNANALASSGSVIC
jgi:hypothetical protein